MRSRLHQEVMMEPDAALTTQSEATAEWGEFKGGQNTVNVIFEEKGHVAALMAIFDTFDRCTENKRTFGVVAGRCLRWVTASRWEPLPRMASFPPWPIGWGGFLLRNLLRHAVETSESPREDTAIDRNNTAGRETLLQRRDGILIFRVVPDRKKYALIGNVEVRIAGGNTKPFSCSMGIF